MKIKNLLFVFLSLFFLNVAFATTYHVGPSRAYISPNALFLANVVQNGDIIEIDVADYIDVAAFANWSADNLIIRGVGGRPHLIANGQNFQGKGIWIISGDNATVENIEFSGATVPDENGAGIRQEGISLTIINCYFHDNENGILTNNPNAGDILVEFSEFSNNGFGDGFTHNIYVGHVNSFTLRYSYMHHAKVGHNVKSRATNNYILYNRIMDETTGNSSRLIDLSNGGFAIIMGNLLMQGPNAPNNNLVGFGLEGLSNPSPNELYFINNTSVNKRTASCIFISIQGGTTIANISNNIFAGIGTLVNGTTTTMNNNISDTNIANMLFINEANYDYNLNANSPAINLGTAVGSVNGFSLTPDKHYVHPINNTSRTLTGTIDVGAYEYEGTLSNDEFSRTQFVIYPNPATENIIIKTLDIKDLQVNIYNSVGQEIPFQKLFLNGDYSIITSSFISGIYFVEVRISGQKKIVKIIIE
jgi:hypothetical protein